MCLDLKIDNGKGVKKLAEHLSVGRTWVSEGHLMYCLKKKFYQLFFFISSLICLQTILLHPQRSKDSKYVLRFEIRQWEGGEKIGRTSECDRQTNTALYYIDVFTASCSKWS